MERAVRQNKILEFLAIFFASLALLLGAVVLVGWYAKIPALIQILPTLVPMQYNTALAFLLVGVSLFFLIYSRPKIALIFGIAVSVIGFLTLFEYVSGLSLGIDQLFMHHYITVETSHPGRMAPNTALCFFFSGFTLILGALFRRFAQRELLLTLLSTLIILLGAIALFGYIVALPTTYGWGNLTSMSVHTAIGFIAVGSGLLFHSLAEYSRLKSKSQPFVPVLTFFIAVTLMIISWQVLIGIQHADIKDAVIETQALIKQDIELKIKKQMDAINQVAKHQDGYKKINVLAHFPDYYAGIAILNSKRATKWLKIPSKNLDQEQLLSITKQQLGKLSDNKIFNILPIIKPANGKNIFAITQRLVEKGKDTRFLVGYIYFHNLLDTILPHMVKSNWVIALHYKRQTVYLSRSKLNQMIRKRWGQTTNLQIKHPIWQMEIWPSKEIIDTVYSWAPTVIFVIGIIISLMLALLLQMWHSLRMARELADQANKAKSRFLSSMSHELRTPLNAAMGYAQLLEYDDTLTPQQKSNASLIRSANKHLLSLINDVLDLAKIESGRVELSIESVALNDVMTECQSLVKPYLERYQVTLAYDADVNAPVVIKADYFRLKQIILNLLTNAMKYNRKNGTVTVFTEPGRSGFIRIGIKDTGKGISAKQKEAMFRPFQRLGAERSNIEGTGIGLVITKNLIEMLNGTIVVESIENVGSVFWVELPIASEEDKKHASSVHNQAIKAMSKKDLSARKKILLVEDNPANQAIVIQQLQYLKYEADVAANGEEGYQAWKSGDYGMILMDCNMPVMDGYEATKMIRRDEYGTDKHVPIIAFTANAYKEELHETVTAGMDDYLVKPVELETLQSKLNQWAQTKTLVNQSEDQEIQEKQPTVSTENNFIDLTTLAHYVGNDMQIQKQILEKFSVSCHEISHDLENAITEKSAQKISFSAHKLKSSAKAVGAIRLAETSLALEQAAKENNWDAINKLTPVTIELIAQVISSITEITSS